MRCATSERRRRLLACLLSVSSLLLTGTALSRVHGLAELEQRALSNPAALAAEKARVRGANARIDLARAPLYPTLGANAEAWAGPGGRLVEVRAGDGTNYRVAGSRALDEDDAFTPEPRASASVSLAGQIYDFGRTRAAERAARSELSAAEAGVGAERLAIVRRLRSAYLTWLSAHAAREIARKNLESAAGLRQAIEGRIAEGTSHAADLTSVRYDEAERALELAKSDAELAAEHRALEAVLAGELPADAEPDYALLERRSAAAKGIKPSPELRALEAQRDAALSTARAHRLARAPVLAAAADAGLAAQGDAVFPVYRVGVSLSISLLDGGQAAASSEIANARALELSALAKSARDEAALARARSSAELSALERQIELGQELLRLAEQALRDAEEQQREGGPFELVTRARLRAAGARRGLLDARIARARLELGVAGER
jgi:outer membrane protein TolC